MIKTLAKSIREYKLPSILTIPSTIQKIDASCFANTSGITHVNYYLSKVPEKAFYLSSNLVSVTFGDNITEIGADA